MVTSNIVLKRWKVEMLMDWLKWDKVHKCYIITKMFCTDYRYI